MYIDKCFVFQNELETVTGQFEEADTKVSTLSKQLANMEGQLADAQDLVSEETRLKLSCQTRLRQAEEEISHLSDQVEDKEEERKLLEGKVQQVTAQVSRPKYSKSLHR